LFVEAKQHSLLSAATATAPFFCALLETNERTHVVQKKAGTASRHIHKAKAITFLQGECCVLRNKLKANSISLKKLSISDISANFKCFI